MKTQTNQKNLKPLNFILAFAVLATPSCDQSPSFTDQSQYPISKTDDQTVKVPLPSSNDAAAKPEENSPDFIYDPATKTYGLTVTTSTLKPQTDLFLIIDNSYSMASIQAKTGEALSKLMESVAKEQLNVNLHLYTTTDFADASPPSYTFSSGFKLFLPHAGGAAGPNGNSLFNNRSYFEIVGGTRKALSDPSQRSGSNFWISDDVGIGQSKFSGALAKNGVLEFRENMSLATLKALSDQAVADISKLGTNGSDVEHALAPIYRLSRQFTPTPDSRQAYWIVTNEDDATKKSLLIGHETEVAPLSGVAFYSQTHNTRLTLEYENRVAAQYRDGVKIADERWVVTHYHVYIGDCKTNPLCKGSTLAQLAGSGVCRTDQHDFMLSEFNAKVANSSRRLMNSSKCSAHDSLAHKVSLTSTRIDDTCSSFHAASQKSFSDYFLTHPGLAKDVFDTAPCLKQTGQPFSARQMVKKFELPNVTDSSAVGSSEVGDMIVRNLSQKVGVKGYSIAVVANGAAASCDQAYSSRASNLENFLKKTPSPSLHALVCEDDYWPVIGRGLQDFIVSAPVLQYKIEFSADKIKSIVIIDKDGSEKTLLKSDYTVTDQSIRFRSGVFAIHDKIKVLVVE